MGVFFFFFEAGQLISGLGKVSQKNKFVVS
jgi:hypothetical protein